MYAAKASGARSKSARRARTRGMNLRRFSFLRSFGGGPTLVGATAGMGRVIIWVVVFTGSKPAAARSRSSMRSASLA